MEIWEVICSLATLAWSGITFIANLIWSFITGFFA